MNRPLRLLVAMAVVTAFSACSWTAAPQDRPDVVAYFSDVGDLVEGGQVQVNDVEVGRITGIDLILRDRVMTAKVAIDVDDDVQVSATDLNAVIRQTSLLGEQFVQLVPTRRGGPFVGDEPVEIPLSATERRVDIEAFLTELSAFIGGGGLEDLNRFTHAQALILEGRSDQLGDTIDELATFTTTLANRKDDLGAAIGSLASAGGTLARNKQTLDDFLDSLEDANALLNDQGDDLGRLFRSLRRFGEVNSRFLAKHEKGINRNLRALEPILEAVGGASGELRRDIEGLDRFMRLFPRSMGGGPNGEGAGDYLQVDAVLCEDWQKCQTQGEKGDVPGQGSGR